MGFGFASAGSLVRPSALASKESNEPPRWFGTRLGGSSVYTARVLTLNPLAGFAGESRRAGRTDPYTFNHRLLRTQFLGVGMWLRHHVAPALGPHPLTRPLTDWSTPACLQLNRLLICSPRVGQGRWPRRGDRPDRSAGWERCGMGEVMQPRPISRPTPVVSPRRSPAGRANLVGPVSPGATDYVRIIGIISTIEHIIT